MVSKILESKILKIEQSCIDVWVEKMKKLMSKFQDDVHPIAWQLLFSQFSQKFPCNNCVSHCIIEFSTIFITITTITICSIFAIFLSKRHSLKIYLEKFKNLPSSLVVQIRFRSLFYLVLVFLVWVWVFQPLLMIFWSSFYPIFELG